MPALVEKQLKKKISVLNGMSLEKKNSLTQKNKVVHSDYLMDNLKVFCLLFIYFFHSEIYETSKSFYRRLTCFALNLMESLWYV